MVAAVVPPESCVGHGLPCEVVSIGHRAVQGFDSEEAAESILFSIPKEMVRLDQILTEQVVV